MKILLSTFYNNFNFNDMIIKKFIYSLDIAGIQGNYPFTIFNGWYNNIRGEDIAVYQDINNVLESYNIISNKVFIDCGNVLIDKKDFYNTFEKIIFETLTNNNTIYFEVANIDLIEYLITNYPNIQIVLHQNYTMWHTEEEIQEILNKFNNNIKFIIITNINPCINVNSIKKIYLLHINKCELCPQFRRCLEKDMESTLNFSIKSIFNDCLYYDYYYPSELIEKIEKINSVYNYEYILFDTECVDRRTTEDNIILETCKLIKEKYYDKI